MTVFDITVIIQIHLQYKSNMAPITKFLTKKPSTSNIISKAIKKTQSQRVQLTIPQKVVLLNKLEAGASVTSLMNEFGVGRSTVSEIKHAKDKIRKFAAEIESSSGPLQRKSMRSSKYRELDEAVYKWYVQQRGINVNVRGVEIMAAAESLAQAMGLECKASAGWLWRFRNRHGLKNIKPHGEAGRGGIGVTAAVMSLALDHTG